MHFRAYYFAQILKIYIFKDEIHIPVLKSDSSPVCLSLLQSLNNWITVTEYLLTVPLLTDCVVLYVCRECQILIQNWSQWFGCTYALHNRDLNK